MENIVSESTAPTRPRGHLFVVSAPSGAGKTTLCKALRETYSDIRYSISHTTRKPRQGEKDGIDYHFTDKATFLKMQEKGFWAEWAQVHDHFYGTSAKILDQALSGGYDILLDIDVQGTLQILEHYSEAVTIFIVAPTLEILKERLLKRGTDDPLTIEKRLMNAQAEIAKIKIYRNVIVNDDLSTAIAQFTRIVDKYRKDKAC